MLFFVALLVPLVPLVLATRVIRIRSRRDGHLVWIRRRALHLHRKRVGYNFALASDLLLWTPVIPHGQPGHAAFQRGTFALGFSATSASSCTLSASPAFWTGGSPSIGCGGTCQATAGPTSAARSWAFTFMATGTNGQRRRLCRPSPSRPRSHRHLLLRRAPGKGRPPPARPSSRATTTQLPRSTKNGRRARAAPARARGPSRSPPPRRSSSWERQGDRPVRRTRRTLWST